MPKIKDKKKHVFAKHYARSGNKVPKSYFMHNGQSQGHKVNELGVIWKGNYLLQFKNYSEG